MLLHGTISQKLVGVLQGHRPQVWKSLAKDLTDFQNLNISFDALALSNDSNHVNLSTSAHPSPQIRNTPKKLWFSIEFGREFENLFGTQY